MEATNARSEVRRTARPDRSASRANSPDSAMETPDAPSHASSAEALPEGTAPAASSGPRPLADILDGLAKPIPERLLETKRIQGSEITYVPWYRAQKILNHYTGGFWEYRIVERWQQPSGDDFMLTVEITIHAAEGAFRRQGTGREEPGVSGYGDTQSNAESMAFRRAAAKWGLGLDLYEGGA